MQEGSNLSSQVQIEPYVIQIEPYVIQIEPYKRLSRIGFTSGFIPRRNLLINLMKLNSRAYLSLTRVRSAIVFMSAAAQYPKIKSSGRCANTGPAKEQIYV